MALLNLTVTPYWLMGMLGAAASAAFVLCGTQRFGVRRDDALYALLYAAVGALIGSKLLFALTMVPPLVAHHDEVTLEQAAQILLGGSVFYGGAIGGAIGAWRYCRRYSIPLCGVAALFAPAIPLFHAFGRVGCYFAGCCYGTVLIFPVQLVEATFNLALCAALTVYRRKATKPWTALAWYGVLYAAVRFALEFFRDDAVRGVMLLSTSQWISIALFALSTALIIKNKKENIMSKFHTVLFDFDGTLADSLPAVGTAVIKTLEKYGYEGLSLDDVRSFIGPPLKDSFSAYPKVVENFEGAYAAYFAEHSALLDRYVIYDGIADVLRALKDAGITVGVATAKNEQNAVDILKLNGLDGYFDFVAGVVRGERDTKNEVIAHALTLSDAPVGNVVMIGDRHYDINGGKAFGLATIGCLWGFGSRDELEQCGADVIIEKPADLTGVLLAG